MGYRYAYRNLWRSLHQGNIFPSLRGSLTVCDCGIGTAAFSLALTESIGTNAHIVGIDLSAEMLQKADQWLTLARVDHHLCQSDVRTLPFAGDFFDMAISAHMLEHLSNPTEGLQEIYRVLRPGAPLVLVITRSGIVGSLIQWHWGNSCFSPKELINLMAEAGFENLRIIPFPFGLARFTSFACVGFRACKMAEDR
ncbi:class I SAM-dependent methyltransferase [Nodosilinea nodulosa]|uniref:class I SAM-dependent methyltransferase n=1 Tax=Nodosilinea nodulosa TaxID=416001 RepID=UPI001CEC8986|nr:class I SAM-dependent methyltransferase [Nodosilinea nodulosa]